jgi:hypothetical protein
MTEDALSAEAAVYADACGDYINVGYIEVKEDWNRPPSAADWDRYVLYGEDSDESVGMCVAYDDESARAFAAIVEERTENSRTTTIWRVAEVSRYPRMQGKVYEKGECTDDCEQLAYVGFTINRRDIDGFQMDWDEFERNFYGVIVDMVRKAGLPDVMDDWKSWFNGAYYYGPFDTVVAIDAVLNQAPELGMQVFTGFPEEFYLADGIEPEKYLEAASD